MNIKQQPKKIQQQQGLNHFLLGFWVNGQKRPLNAHWMLTQLLPNFFFDLGKRVSSPHRMPAQLLF